MTARNVIARLGRDASSLTCSMAYDFGDNLAEMTEKFGAGVVYEHALDIMVIALQGRMRAHMTGGKNVPAKSPADTVKALADWKPATSNRDPAKKIEIVNKAVASMTPAQKAELLASLQADMAKAAPAIVPPVVAAKKLVKGNGKSGKRA